MVGSRAWQRATETPATAEAAANAAPVGKLAYTVGLTAPTGWIVGDGKTIGSAASGATGRANSDAIYLYQLIWALDATLYPSTTNIGGATTRGASAVSDFTANKRLPLPDLRGRAIAGLDTIGGSSASRVTTAASGVDATKVGAVGGDQLMPAHSHTQLFISAATAVQTTQTNLTVGAGWFMNQGHGTLAAGTGSAANMPPTLVGLPIIKL